jgi:hypothetical protein
MSAAIGRTVSHRGWLGFLAVGGVGSAVVWLLLPHDSEIDTIWLPLFKVAIFGCLLLAIALAPNRSRLGYLAAIAPFLLFLGYVIPRISYFTFFGGTVTTNPPLTGEKYTFLYLLLYPGIVLSVCLAYRLGGGRAGTTIKIGLTGVLLIFSGFLDVLWPLVNPVPLPATIQAQHFKILLGRFATYQEAVALTLAHVPLLVLVNLLPLNRWLGPLEP